MYSTCTHTCIHTYIKEARQKRPPRQKPPRHKPPRQKPPRQKPTQYATKATPKFKKVKVNLTTLLGPILLCKNYNIVPFVMLVITKL